MSEEEKEVILNTKKKIETTQKGLNDNKYYGERFNLEQEIKREQILLNLIERQAKVIDLMADKLFRHGFFVVEPVKKYDVESELYIKSKTKEEIKEYFYKKVEEEE